MEKRPTAVRVLRALASGAVMSPERISTITKIANQTVRNLLVHLKSEALVDHIGYKQYKITELGLMQVKISSKPSTDQTSRRSQ